MICRNDRCMNWQNNKCTADNVIIGKFQKCITYAIVENLIGKLAEYHSSNSTKQKDKN